MKLIECNACGYRMENPAEAAERDMAAWREKYNDAVADRVAAEREVAILRDKLEGADGNWAEAEREVERLREIVQTCERDIGLALSDREAAERKLAKVLDRYEVAVSDILDWAAYASDYFIKKHDLAGVVERHQAIIKEARDE